jgi:hypothetical protein
MIDNTKAMDEKDDLKQPIYLKAKLIFDLIHQVIKYADKINEDDVKGQITQEYVNFLRESSALMIVKLSSSLREDIPYDLKMENATIVRKSAREVLTNISGLELMEFREIDYLSLVRKEMEEFRVLFAEWVKTFDPWHYSIDRWGLFNPPGVNYDDHDPDDDIPFQNPLSDDDI